MPPPRSKTWVYFKKIDKVLAKCKFCLQEVKYCGNTSNLAKHLKKHQNSIESMTESNKHSHSPTFKTTPKQSKLFLTKPDSIHSNDFDVDAANQSMPMTPIEVNIQQSTSTSIPTNRDTKTDPTPMSALKFCLEESDTEAEEYVDEPKSVALQRPIVDAFKRISSYAEGGSRHRKITMALLYFICKDYRPFSIIEGRGFKMLIKELSPSYKIPSVTTVKHLLDDKYEVTKVLIKNSLLATSHVSLTFDAWTETMSEKSFLGVTVHFLEGTCLKTFSLAVAELKERHTANYISEVLEKTLSDWEINHNKIVTVVTDNGANVTAAVQRTFGKHRHTPCFAHTINLVATHTVGQKNIKPIILKVREIIKYVKNSVIISDLLRKKQYAAGVLEGNIKKLILDVPTRWNSVFFMINRFIEMVSLIGPILLEDIAAPVMPTAIEVDTLRQLLDLLKPLEFVTKESSGENYVTISKVIPMISCLLKQLENIKPRFDVICEVKDVLQAEIVRRFGLIEQVKPIAIATLLDPRFKNLHFIDPVACSNAMAELRKLSKLDSSSSESEGEITNPDSDTYDFWAPHKLLAHGQKKKKSSFLNDELSLYLSNPVSPLKSNPLELWEDMKCVFPMLYKQARISFTMVATSVPSERLFSKAGATITKCRNRLTGSRLQKLLLLADLPEEFWF